MHTYMHFFETQKVGYWPMKMVPIPSANTVHC